MIREGQIYEQQRTPRQGDDALWEVVGDAICNQIHLECIGTGEKKTISKYTLKNKSDYRLVEGAIPENSPFVLLVGSYTGKTHALGNHLRGVKATLCGSRHFICNPSPNVEWGVPTCGNCLRKLRQMKDSP